MNNEEMGQLAVLKKPEFSLAQSDPAAVAAAETAKARIQSAFLMALHKPRNADQARINILEACKRPIFAERVEFSKPVGGKKIKGPSIRFAELAIREWGNVLTETQVVFEDDSSRRVKLFVTDLESNTSHSKEIVVAKTIERKYPPKDREIFKERTNTKGEKVYIVEATDDELHNKEAALISKALRNEGLRLIPSDIIDEGIMIAKETLGKKDSEDPLAAKKILFDGFAGIGIKPKDIEQYLKHKAETISPAEMQDLRGMYRAIKDGEASWNDYINPEEIEQKTEAKKEALKEKLKKGKEAKAQPAQEGEGLPLAEELIKAISETTADRHLDNWFGKHKKEIDARPEAEKAKIMAVFGEKKESFKAPHKEEPPQETENSISCPNRKDAMISKTFCEKCSGRKGCPSWEVKDAAKYKTMAEGIAHEFNGATKKSFKNLLGNNDKNIELLLETSLPSWLIVEDAINAARNRLGIEEVKKEEFETSLI